MVKYKMTQARNPYKRSNNTAESTMDRVEGSAHLATEYAGQAASERINDLEECDTRDMLPIGAFVVSWTPEWCYSDSDKWYLLSAGSVPQKVAWLRRILQSSRLVGLRLFYRHAEETTIRVWRRKKGKNSGSQLWPSALKADLQELMRSLDMSSKTWSPEVVNAWIPHQGPVVMPCKQADVVVRDISQFRSVPSLFYMSLAERQAYHNIAMNKIPGLRTNLSLGQIATVQELLLQENFPTILCQPPMFPVDGPTGETLYISEQDPENTLLYEQDDVGQYRRCITHRSRAEKANVVDLLAFILATLTFPLRAPQWLWRENTSRPLVTPLVAKLRQTSLTQICASVLYKRSKYPGQWRELPLPQMCLTWLEQEHERQERHRQEQERQCYFQPDDQLERDSAYSKSSGRRVFLSHATLILVPDNKLAFWRSTILKHVDTNIVRVDTNIDPVDTNIVRVMSTGRIGLSISELPDAELLSQQHIVLVPLLQYKQEYFASSSPLSGVLWRRVITCDISPDESWTTTPWFLPTEQLVRYRSRSTSTILERLILPQSRKRIFHLSHNAAHWCAICDIL